MAYDMACYGRDIAFRAHAHPLGWRFWLKLTDRGLRVLRRQIDNLAIYCREIVTVTGPTRWYWPPRAAIKH